MNEFISNTGEKPYDAMIFWNITRYCNLRCPQCVANALPEKNMKEQERINIPALKKFMAKLKMPVKMHITGGEPLLVENIIEAFSVIAQNHYLALITNLLNDKVKDLAATIDPLRFDVLVASAHIMELEKRDLLETFISNALLLKKRGFPIHIVEVAYPFRIEYAGKYRKMFKERGLDLEYEVFRGTWNNKQYPDAYTENEFEVFNPNRTMPISSAPFSRKGKLCNAGYNIAVLLNTGVIQPCFLVKKKIGHLNRGIKFEKKMIKCPARFCDCPFPVFYPDVFNKAERKFHCIKPGSGLL